MYKILQDKPLNVNPLTLNSLSKIISGGQTGVDRAALDAAISCKIPHGGWCPKGRKAEDGLIEEIYLLEETPSDDYSQRTEWNVRDSDGTLIIVNASPMGGTALTIQLAITLSKPYLVFDASVNKNLYEIIQWLKENNISTLNVAGPRASQADNIYNITFEIMKEVINHFTPSSYKEPSKVIKCSL
jgi:hypothetical protein